MALGGGAPDQRCDGTGAKLFGLGSHSVRSGNRGGNLKIITADLNRAGNAEGIRRAGIPREPLRRSEEPYSTRTVDEFYTYGEKMQRYIIRGEAVAGYGRLFLFGRCLAFSSIQLRCGRTASCPRAKEYLRASSQGYGTTSSGSAVAHISPPPGRTGLTTASDSEEYAAGIGKNEEFRRFRQKEMRVSRLDGWRQFKNIASGNRWHPIITQGTAAGRSDGKFDPYWTPSGKPVSAFENSQRHLIFHGRNRRPRDHNRCYWSAAC
jgi:ribosome modulation factor